MSEYSNFPQYQSIINNAYAGTESQILSQLNDYKNPTLTSTEMQYNENEMIVKPAIYSEPKYIKKEEVHETLQPIAKEIKLLPIKTKQKVRTLDTVYNKTIVLSDKDDLNELLQNNQMFEQQVNAPIPTKSTIANLCKDSVLIPSSNYYPSQPQSNNYQIQSEYLNAFNEAQMYETKVISKVIDNNPKSSINQPIASKVSKITTSSKNNSKINYPAQHSTAQAIKFQSTDINNINNNYHISKVSNFPSTYSNINNEHPGMKVTKISSNYGNTNVNKINQNQIGLKVPNIQSDYHQSKIQMSKIPYMSAKSNNKNDEGGFVEATDISKKSNKNYIQTYFNDDDIPKPIVYEGNALENSDIKPNIKNSNNLEQPQEKKIIESSIKNSKNGQSSLQKISYPNQANTVNNNINNKSMNQTNTNDNYNKSIKQNNISNKSYQKNDSKEAQKVNSLLAQIPVDQSEIISHQPSINMSQKQSILFKKSVHQSTVDPNLVEDSKIQRQSKMYQQQSNIQSNIQKSNVNQSSYKQSKIIEKSSANKNSQGYAQTQKSNMTYQQPYNQYSQIQKTQNPQIYYSQDIQNNQNSNHNNQKPIKESGNMNISGHKSKINQINSSMPISQTQNINNQSNIYQTSVRHAGLNNIGNENNVTPSKIIKSNNNIINQTVNSQHQSKIGESSDLIASSNKSRERESGINVKGNSSSFPTQSNANKFNSKEIVPPNPFEEQSSSIKGSTLKMLEDKLKDSENK